MLLRSASGPCLRGRLSSNVRPHTQAMSQPPTYYLRAAFAFRLAAAALGLFLAAPLAALAFVEIARGSVAPGEALALLLLLGSSVACWLAAGALKSERSGALWFAWLCAIAPALVTYPLGWGIPISGVLLYYCYRATKQS